MAFNFILMLTAGDRTIPDARARLDEALEGGAHNARKPHLRAWILRHAKALAGHRLICTGGTGAMIAEVAPELVVQRLQRGTRGGDQQLGALIATGELDAVIFFADPTAPMAAMSISRR